jgi:hypothetical protein
MATKQLTRVERDITIIEQILAAMRQMNPSMTQLPLNDIQETPAHATLPQ